jgi:hypothetical protein
LSTSFPHSSGSSRSAVLQRAAASAAGEEQADDERLPVRSTVDEMLLDGEPVLVEDVL